MEGGEGGAKVAAGREELGSGVRTHRPGRRAGGYGPNQPALQDRVAQGASLLICVDCGGASADVLSPLAGQADIIVLDHHKSEDALPAIHATVNPNRPDCP